MALSPLLFGSDRDFASGGVAPDFAEQVFENAWFCFADYKGGN